ncbi:MAG: serine/threonine-protein kinase [Planctomycetota bacterium]
MASRYHLLHAVGEGGQGTVYAALQRPGRRLVAFKILGHQAPSTEVRQRFQRELQVLSTVRHGNVVRLIEGGELPDRRLFLVMDFVDGEDLESHLKRLESGPNRRPIEDLVALFVRICAGVAAAHRRGVVHRDLKPSNILVDREGMPFLVDFGIARLAESPRDSEITRIGRFVGSPVWCAPEQLEGSGSVDVRSDVYTLGLLLYRLLTGALPYRTDISAYRLLEEKRAALPERPSRRLGRRRIPRDLDVVALKALALDPERRYPSADELAADCQRAMAGLPVSARHEGALYLLACAIRRNRLAALGSALLVFVLAAYAWNERGRSRSSAAAASLSQVRFGRADDSVPRAEQALWRELLFPPAAARHDGVARSGATIRHATAHWALRELYTEHPCLATVVLPAFGANPSIVCLGGGEVAVSSGTDRIEVLSVPDLTPNGVYSAEPTSKLGGITYSSDHDLLVARDADRVLAWPGRRAGPLRLVEDRHPEFVQPAVLGDGSVLVQRRDGLVRALLDGSTTELPASFPKILVAWSLLCPQNRRLLLRGWDSRGSKLVVLYDLEDEKVEWQQPWSTRVPTFASGGRHILMPVDEIGSALGPALFDTQTLERVDSLPYGRATIGCASHPSRELIALSSLTGRSIVLWDVSARAEIRSFAGHSASPWSLAFAAHRDRPAHGMLVSADSAGTVKTWDLDNGEITRLGADGAGENRSELSFWERGQVLEVVDGRLHLWDAATGAHRPLTPALGSTVTSLDVGPGARLAVTSSDGHLYAVEPRLSATPRRLVSFDNEADAVRWDPHGQQLAVAGHLVDGNLKFARLYTVGWDGTDAPTRIHLPDADDVGARRVARISSLAWSVDGSYLLCGETVGSSRGSRLFWVDVERRRALPGVQAHDSSIRDVARHPTEDLFATASDDATIRLWQLGATEPQEVLLGHGSAIYTVDFDDTGDLLASGDTSGEVRLWIRQADESWIEAFKYQAHESPIFGLGLSPDGTRVATSAEDGTIQVCDLTYRDRNIAGNLAYWMQRFEKEGPSIEDREELERWAADELRAH